MVGIRGSGRIVVAPTDGVGEDVVGIVDFLEFFGAGGAGGVGGRDAVRMVF